MKFYTATKSRSQGRDSWSVIFRHPARLEVGTGKVGRRVRRGLGTADDAEASRLVTELNEILSTPALWESTARVSAETRFDPRVIEIFYDGLEATEIDFSAVRDAILPLPGVTDGYRTVLLLGTTGAGKTTVVRQILGTNPDTERFPSTSTAKTTVADTELVVTSDTSYQAVVTFTPRDKVIDYLAENVSAAALAALDDKDDADLIRRLLDHVDQRFRFSYVLGRPANDGDDDFVEDDVSPAAVDVGEYGSVDLTATAQLVRHAVREVRTVAHRHAEAIGNEFRPDGHDERVAAEYVEENLDSALRESDEFHRIVDALVDEIEKRFALLDVGQVRRNRQGWPVSWTWSTDDRTAFIKTITRFSSNYAPLFGRLLTPLVNGIRVAGPFQPSWGGTAPKLVIVDGEGLGHTPKSAAALSTHTSRQILQADAVLLVDNATQPMQAAPVAALKSIAVSGEADKLHILFTHVDLVKGDNLPTFSAREEHVLASMENVLSSIGEELGPAAERILRRRLDRARYFVGGINETLDTNRKLGNRSIQQLEALLTLIQNPDLAADGGPSRPVFDRMNLSLAVTEAAKNFHTRWRGVLGLDVNPDVPKEHWARIKALTRRLAEGRADQYDTLRPIADLLYELQRQIYLLLQRPSRWGRGVPADSERQAVIDEIANAVTKDLIELTQRRLKEEVRLGWQTAYQQKGQGSTFVRAGIIAADVYDKGAPIPTVSASPDQNRFLKEVAAIISDTANTLDFILE